MENWSSDNLSWKFAVFLLLAVCVSYYILFFARARVSLEIEVEQPTWFKIYWAEQGELYSEKRMSRVRVNPHHSNYSFYLVNLKNIVRLRIDTHEYPGRAIVKKILIRQKGFEDIVLASDSTFSQLESLDQVRNYFIKDNMLTVDSTGRDPNFLLEVQARPMVFSWLEEVLRLAALGCIVIVVYRSTAALVIGYRFVPLCLAAILILVTSLALTSRENSHPDEFVHVAAVEYYQDNWLPPVIDDVAILNTYSPYGVSRLNTDEIFYLLSGKFAKITAPLFLNHYLASRSFNVFLLLLIAIYTLRVPDARIVALPLLISPQIWYLFSYCNSDGFAIAVCFFVGCQIVVSESMLKRYLAGNRGLVWLLHGCILGCGVGVLLLLKRNYLPFTFLVALIAVTTFARLSDRDARMEFLKRTVLVCIIGLALFAGKKEADFWKNGSDRQAAIASICAKRARLSLNPVARLETISDNLYMKDRGVPLQDLITKHTWFERTFRSAFGVYGYLSIAATDAFYDVVRWSASLLLLYFFATVFIRGGPLNSLYGVSVLIFAVALIAASLHHSWIADFQPQGRYLFAIVPMLGILCGQNKDILNKRWISLLTVWMFCLSLYSCITVAYLHLPRIMQI